MLLMLTPVAVGELLAMSQGTPAMWRINPDIPTDVSGIYGSLGDGYAGGFSLASHDGELYTGGNQGE